MTKLNSIILLGFFRLLSLFPIRVLRRFGKLLGTLLWQLNTRAREVTEVNLAICFPDMPEAERRALAINSLQNLAMTALELGPIWLSPVEKLLNRVTSVEGEYLIQQAITEGKGVILLAPHVGAWELLGVYLAKYYPLTCLYQPPDNPAMHELIVNARTRNGGSLAPTNTKGVKILLQTLKRGEVIAILPDQVPPLEGGDYANFFDTPALTTTLVKNLAGRTGAKVITASAYRVPGTDDFMFIFGEVGEDISADDTQKSLTAMNKSVERCVLVAPEQYQWEYKRFKKPPPGQKKYY